MRGSGRGTKSLRRQPRACCLRRRRSSANCCGWSSSQCYYAGPKALVVCDLQGGPLGRKLLGDRAKRQSIGQQENPAPLGPRVTRHDHMAFLPRQALDKQASKQASKQVSKQASKQGTTYKPFVSCYFPGKFPCHFTFHVSCYCLCRFPQFFYFLTSLYFFL